MAGATEITIEILPIICPRVAAGTRFITVVISRGNMMAVPLACTIRASSRTSNPGATAAIKVPRLKRPIAAMNSGRVLKR